MKFLEYLVSQGIINAYQMEDIAERMRAANGDVDRALEAVGLASDIIRSAKAGFYGVPERAINFQSFSFDVLKYVAEDAASNYKFVPIGMTNGVLEVGVLNPGDVAAEGALQFIASKINLPINRFVISYDDFKRIIEGYRGVVERMYRSGAVESIKVELVRQNDRFRFDRTD
jgi:hypothetical protein